MDQIRPGWVFEAFDARPYDLFVLRNGATRALGRRYPSGAGRRRTSLVDASNILGTLEREQVFSEGVTAFFRPLTDGCRRELFRELARRPDTDLYYPFPALSRGNGREWCTPADYWQPTPDRVRALDEDEALLREKTIALLADYDLRGRILFDPGCSTGTFLSSIKARYPGAIIVGQDSSPAMAEFCRDRFDDVYVGDSATPGVAEESVDFVFFRFLNFHVITTQRAHDLFLVNAKRCRVGGHILVAGYTPVLLSAEWFEILGLQVLQRIAFFDERDAVCQFYWLRREGPLHNEELTASNGR
jgi:isonocardicin synthase